MEGWIDWIVLDHRVLGSIDVKNFVYKQKFYRYIYIWFSVVYELLPLDWPRRSGVSKVGKLAK